VVCAGALGWFIRKAAPDIGPGENQADIGYSGGPLADATPFPALSRGIAGAGLHRDRVVCLRVTAALFPAGSQFNYGA
jgi:hypothetical protein